MYFEMNSLKNCQQISSYKLAEKMRICLKNLKEFSNKIQNFQRKR